MSAYPLAAPAFINDVKYKFFETGLLWDFLKLPNKEVFIFFC
jgi:hypothetical protein